MPKPGMLAAISTGEMGPQRYARWLILSGCAALCAIILMILGVAAVNARRVRHLEREAYPAVLLSHDLATILYSAQRGLQDAVATEDVGGIDRVGIHVEQFKSRIDAANHAGVSAADTLQHLRREFAGYISEARSLSRILATQPDIGGNEAILARVVAMQKRYSALRERIRRMGADQQRAIETAFRSTVWTQWQSAIASGVFALLVAAALAALAKLASRSIGEAFALRSHLERAQRMDAVGRMAGGICHDLNNGLAAVKGHCELLLGESLEPSIRDDITAIATAADRASGLTRRLLMFSRHQVFDVQVLELNQWLGDLLKLGARLLPESIEASFVAHPDAGSVEADPARLEQVLMNLLLNARDAMPEGGRVKISTGARAIQAEPDATHPLLGAGTYAVLTVTDTGTGMTAHVLEHAFEPFFTTKDPAKGSGLGLSIVHGIVQQANGSVAIWSEPGAGTTVEILLPKCARPATAAHLDAPIAPVKPDRQGTGTILVAEDDDSVRQVVGAAVKRMGYEVLLAGDGVEALHLANGYGDRINLLLTDVVMPLMGGVELAERLRALRPGIPVLYMSGYEAGELARLTGESSEEAILTKPFAFAELSARIKLLTHIAPMRS